VINLAGIDKHSFAHGFAKSRIFPRSKPGFKNGQQSVGTRIYEMSASGRGYVKTPNCNGLGESVSSVGHNLSATVNFH
jgi:hypothetical protein